MRFGVAALSFLSLLACSPPAAQTKLEAGPQPSVAADSQEPAVGTTDSQQRSAPVVGGDHLDFSCDNPLYALASGGATIEDLRAALGASNVVERSHYDDVWVALYPGDPAREVSVSLDQGGRVSDVRVENQASAARLGGVLRMGDDLAAVQRFNGALPPLDGNVVQSFALAEDPDSPCAYRANVRSNAPGVDQSNGTGSSDPAAQPPNLRVSALHMSRRPQ